FAQFLLWLLRRAGLPRFWDKAVGMLSTALWWLLGIQCLFNPIMFCVLMAVGIISAHNRHAQQEAFLSILALTTDRQAPLGASLAAYAEECPPRFRDRVLQLVEQLDKGVRLDEALDDVGNLVPPRGLLAAQVGADCDLMGPALQNAVRLRAEFSRHMVFKILYPLIGFVNVFLVLMFLMYWVVPKFMRIFFDFEIELPLATRLLISATEGMTSPAVHVVLFVTWIFLLYVATWLLGWTHWVPAFLTRRLDAATSLRMLAAAEDHGCKLSGVLRTLANRYPRRSFRRKLARAEEAVRMGRPWWDSLRRCGIVLDQEAVFLESAGRSGNLAWAMRETADGGERRLRYRFQAWSNLLFPLSVAALGLIVAFVAFAFFIPLLSLMQNLAQIP
ncbi:MAG: type II secretion system F family protein, partial [Planctomycetales bacterium]